MVRSIMHKIKSGSEKKNKLLMLSVYFKIVVQKLLSSEGDSHEIR